MTSRRSIIIIVIIAIQTTEIREICYSIVECQPEIAFGFTARCYA